MNNTPFNYIDCQKDLEQCCLALQASPLLSVDTEFVRERTYYSQPGLIQVSDGTTISLIDPNACEQLQVFFDLLESPDIRIAMHSSSEDVELFYSMGCGTIENLFDTQIAAAWLGEGQSISLQRLIEAHEKILIPKGHSRTNWLQRPLTDAQLNYAAVDVLYLNAICLRQEAALVKLGFFDFMVQDCDLRCEKTAIGEGDNLAYLKVKRAVTAIDDGLTRLQHLASWRERQARKDDKPRQHLIKDELLLAISLQSPTDKNQLSEMQGVTPYILRRYGQKILEIISNIPQVSAQDNQPVISLRSLPGAGKTLNDCRDLMKQINNQQQIPIEVLPSKRWLEQFLLHYAVNWYPQPDGWKGWRKQLLEEPIQQLITKNGFKQSAG
ncbi:MAG: hypothetical protein DRQ47_10170 [Gammaproteobacteria bacterium]|nr:MAG: hypothetical protein DRQ47_10170 [Gammaproteobacteria bacterium]